MSKSCRIGQEAAAKAIRGQMDTIVAMAPAVRELDAEGIHDMRVASRRLRMALQVYRPYLPGKPRKVLRRQAKRITQLLGNRRELDVMVAMLREHRGETRALWRRFMDHAVELLDQRRADQAEFCLEAVAIAEGDTFQEAAAPVLDGIDAADYCVLDLARDGLTEAQASARAARKAWKQSDAPEDLHQIRIELKHLRYGCEFHRALYGEAMGEYIKHVKGVQSILGEWNECRLLEDMVLTIGNAADYRLAQGAPLVAEAYGNRAAALEAEFRPLGKVLLGKDGRKAFKQILETATSECECAGGALASG